MPRDIPKALTDFGTRQGPFIRVVLVAAVLIGALVSTVHSGRWAAYFAESLDTRLLFGSYFLVTAAMWLVYFASGLDAPGFRVRSLRHLLSTTSEMFGSRVLTADDNRTDSLASAYRDKARTSITMLSMLSAGAALILTRALAELPITTEKPWDHLMAMAAAAAALVALVCFIVSVDGYDVMYNLFGAADSVERVHMLQFFYVGTRNTRYYGVMFLLWSVCLFGARYDAQFGAFCASIVVAVGWSHWFPSVPVIGQQRQQSRVGLALRMLLIGAPVLWIPAVHEWAVVADALTGFEFSRAPDYAFAVGSALLWAVSALVVRKGLATIPPGTVWPRVLVGLLLSLVVGSFVLLGVAGIAVDVRSVSPWTIGAGVLLFPVGTGLYYASGHAFGKRVEFASQFANVKPLLSVAFGVVILHETLSAGSILALTLIAAGLAILIVGARRGAFSIRALGLGLLLACAWGLGEAFAKLGLGSGPSTSATFEALVSGTIIAIVVALPVIIRRRREAFEGAGKWIGFFCLHGILSFGLAYACLFESIKRIGVGETALINAFWPGLSIGFSWVFTRQPVPTTMIAAATCLLAGSLVQVILIFAR